MRKHGNSVFGTAVDGLARVIAVVKGSGSAAHAEFTDPRLATKAEIQAFKKKSGAQHLGKAHYITVECL